MTSPQRTAVIIVAAILTVAACLNPLGIDPRIDSPRRGSSLYAATLPTQDSDANDWGEKLNAWLLVDHSADGTHDPNLVRIETAEPNKPIIGLTWADTPAEARAVLEIGTASGTTTVNLPSPAAFYSNDPNVCLWGYTPAMTVTRVRVTCNADPPTEIDADLRYADTFISKTNPVTICALDTTSGASDSGVISVSVPEGKCVYIVLNAQPDNTITQLVVDIASE
jgi:hypothetical protein